MTDSIIVSTMNLGAYSANTFTGFSNPAGSVTSNTFWTSTSQKYAVPNDATLFDWTTIATSRDFEVTTYARFFGIFGRFDGVKNQSVYFLINEEGGLASSLEVGIATNINHTNALFSGDFTRNILGSKVLGSIPGYVNAADGRTWTFGASGFQLYVKMNGVECLRITDYRLPMNTGNISLKTGSGYGFCDTTVNYLVPVSIFSNLPNLDFRDFGVKTLTAVGSIAAGSLQTLTLQSNPGFAVGDKIIIEVGGEAGGGQRATVGVGGTWPALHYASAAARDADTSQPFGTYAYIDGNLGQLYFWGSGPWGAIVVGGDNYVNEKVIPLALTTTITAVSGNTITLGTSATIPTTNANVYFDNFDQFGIVFNPSIGSISGLEPSNITVSIPSGTYACRNQMSTLATSTYTGRVGWTITGAGVSSTFIKAPYGAQCTGLNLSSCTSCTVQNLTILGNFRTTWGFMFNLPANNPNTWNRGSQYALLGTLCNNCTFTNINVTDIASENGAIGWKSSGGCVASNTNVTLTTGFAMEGWCQIIADSSNCHIYDSTCVSQTFISANMEIDNSTNCSLVRTTVHNGFYSVNSVDQWLLEENTLIIDGNNDNPYRPTVAGSGFQINNNRFNQTGTGAPPGGGGRIINPTALMNGYHNGVDRSWQGGAINISDVRCVNYQIIADPPWTQRNPNSPLTKGYIKMPAYAGNVNYSGNSINNGQGPKCYITGIRCDSTANPTTTECDLLNNQSGCVTENCIVETLGFQTTGTACLTHAQWNALPLVTIGPH